MPGGDRTGPRGGGPKTGRGLGYCAGDDQPGYAASQPAQGLGLGFRWGGRGSGRGRGWWNRSNAGFWSGRGRGGFVAPAVSQDQDIDSLKAQAQELQNALRGIQDRLNKLEA
jgi:hypothetical protein